ncbi:MAG: transglycosylase domain-containing protein [Myxococcota bacterium]|nr:transglycosylase domain-containing protein [Myxococcota bacterium]
MMDRLKDKGISFSDPSASGPHTIPEPDLPTDATPPTPKAAPKPPKIEARSARSDRPEMGRVAAPEPTRPLEPTPAMQRRPAAPPEPRESIPFLPPPPEQARPPRSAARIKPPAAPAPAGEAAADELDTATGPTRTVQSPSATAPTRPRAGGGSRFGGASTFLKRLLGLGVVLAVLGMIGMAGVFSYFSGDLPTVEALGEYEPPTVTVVYDAKGRVLGEIYEKRRYVIPLDAMPTHLQNAFLAAEDANFWTHDGIDVGGIFRAVLRNLAKGKKAQGASTITQQVARNFLLTREKTFVRKIREVILAQRVEEAFDKEHILYLYLNQIYLGSGAYGVEAAARTYFDKSVGDLTLAESAILAGLPQRPSDYSPHRHWKKARTRQLYVLNQMLRKDFIDQATHDAAANELVQISPKKNEFLQQAPFFTEHVRRYLVDTYGFDKIYNDGLSVKTTCDLDLQKAAQEAVVSGVNIAGNRRGWRGAIELLPEAEIAPRLASMEEALREEESKAVLAVGSTDDGAVNPGGYGPLPEQSSLTAGALLNGVILTVKTDYAVAGVGSHKAIIPLSWSKWAYEIDVERSWKYRSQTSMRNVVQRGDVVQVRIAATDAKADAATKPFAMSLKGPFAAAELAQDPELQGALFSYRVDTGAVTAMVGGVDFENSEYNRATQARRQVGSTFKPIVYASAIASKKFTAGSMVQDAPTVIGEAGGTMWKPSNYGGEYLGDITLRRALAMSRNVCTVRVLDVIGPDTVYELAGPQLRIGYQEPSCSRTHIPVDEECIGERSASPVTGMSWCEYCDASTCPKVRVDERFDGQCLDEKWDSDGFQWCHSCDTNIRVCDWYKEKNISRALPCNGARADGDDDVVCRACDLSMGLGSSSLTMVELSRAYSAFATYGNLVEPYFIEEVVDRDGTVIESHQPVDAWPVAMEPGVASVAHWLLRGVATGGTAAKTNQLGIEVAGKTGTTNSFRDAWFVGYNPEMVTSVWVGFDQPKNMGQTFTGGDTALPIWMDYMKQAAPRASAPRFPNLKGVVWAPIDETSGLVAEGGRRMPFLPGTLPVAGEGAVGQVTASDLLTSDF